MPEIGEVARIVHYLRKHLTNRRIAAVITQDDPIVYGKVGTTASAFSAALKGKTILDARQQGKYFWLVMDSPPHPLLHFGMTGWMKFNNDETAYYKPAREIRKDIGRKKSDEDDRGENENGQEEAGENNNVDVVAELEHKEDWPPKFHKFVLQMDGEPKVEAAFVDARRLARIRLVDVPADQMRLTSPLKENGPDPVIDKDILTSEWLVEKMRSKRVPVKALLLDQAQISGVGNWVADEVLYHARIHPEQYSNTLNDEQLKQLHESLTYVCTTAVETLADSSKYPQDWLMKHRWGKGKKDGDRLPSGEKIVHLKVGGRTSAVVPSRQKKTGPVAGDIDLKTKVEEGISGSEDSVEERRKDEGDQVKQKAKPKARSRVSKTAQSDGVVSKTATTEDDKPAPNSAVKRSSRTKKTNYAETTESEDEVEVQNATLKATASSRKRKAADQPSAAEAKASKKPKSKASTESKSSENIEGTKQSSKRRSTRNSTGG